MKVYIVQETDWEYTAILAVFDSLEKAKGYLNTSEDVDRKSYHYPIQAMEVQ